MSSSAISRLARLNKHICPSTDSTNEGGSNSFGCGLVNLAPHISEALSRRQAVVALESTIISHGMPYPQNLEAAKELEAIVRENGAIPATIAIINGIPSIGLVDKELEFLAKLGSRVQKTARRDIAYVVATGGNGATTVSATMFFAYMVGIHIFITGGIGGVHRDSNHSMDISSDLTEFGRTPVMVVSAGVKSILDIPRTLEYLETQGVCVAAYKTDEFPAFFTATSGCKVPCRVDSPEQCARLFDATSKLELGNGILIAVPIPKQHSAPGIFIESFIHKALAEARGVNNLLTLLQPRSINHRRPQFAFFRGSAIHQPSGAGGERTAMQQDITGNAITPFLLRRVNELTGGASLAANIALLRNNALIGAKIAVALAQIRGAIRKGDCE